MSLEITPIGLDEANAFVDLYHRHHKAVPGCKFCIAVSDMVEVVSYGTRVIGTIRGVAIVGRPVGRMLDDSWTLEVNRLCTDGTRNGCSMLYSAAWKAARALGYKRLITYTLPEEGGASLRGAGWRCLGETGGGSWNRLVRPRIDPDELLRGQKLLWEAT